MFTILEKKMKAFFIHKGSCKKITFLIAVLLRGGGGDKVPDIKGNLYFFLIQTAMKTKGGGGIRP